MDVSRSYQDREQRGTCHLNVLRNEENSSPLDAVGNYASDQRKKKDRDAAEKLIQSEQKGRMTEAIDQPSLRYDLHPGADARSTGTEPH